MRNQTGTRTFRGAAPIFGLWHDRCNIPFGWKPGQSTGRYSNCLYRPNSFPAIRLNPSCHSLATILAVKTSASTHPRRR
ncbi:MAG: hypothetical protein LBF41_07400 [Deltaproteobacteria bacterium]|nr:hypothetical protein [Deltaproteobacteria bacterium]